MTIYDFPNKELKEIESGLYVVATPIGNLEDITLRALRILKSVRYILCEDTRVTSKLLKSYSIDAKLLIFNDHSENRVGEYIELIKSNPVAIVSDAGTPMVSDPGYKLIKECYNQNLKIFPIVGPSSITASISVSPIPCKQFVFYGFYDGKSSSFCKFADYYKDIPIILFISPKKIEGFLELLLEKYENAEIFIAKEISKIHEHYIMTDIKSYKDNINRPDFSLEKGEYVLILDIKSHISSLNPEEIERIIRENKNLSTKDLADYISEIGNIPRKTAYKLVLEYSKS